MNKPSIFAGLAGLASLFELRMPKSIYDNFPNIKPLKPGERMLCPASKGTYVRAKHGPLVDEKGNPRYA